MISILDLISYINRVKLKDILLTWFYELLNIIMLICYLQIIFFRKLVRLPKMQTCYCLTCILIKMPKLLLVCNWIKNLRSRRDILNILTTKKDFDSYFIAHVSKWDAPNDQFCVIRFVLTTRVFKHQMFR